MQRMQEKEAEQLEQAAGELQLLPEPVTKQNWAGRGEKANQRRGKVTLCVTVLWFYYL